MAETSYPHWEVDSATGSEILYFSAKTRVRYKGTDGLVEHRAPSGEWFAPDAPDQVWAAGIIADIQAVNHKDNIPPYFNIASAVQEVGAGETQTEITHICVLLRDGWQLFKTRLEQSRYRL